MGGGNIVDVMLVPFKNPLGKQVSIAKWWSKILDLLIQQEPNHDIRHFFQGFFFVSFNFFNLQITCKLYFQASFLTIKHTIITEMAPGIKSEIIIQPLKEGWLEALMSNPFLACLFCTVEGVPLAPLNQLSPCPDTSAHTVAGFHFPALCFSLDSAVHPHLPWRVSLRLEATHRSRPYLCWAGRNDTSTSIVSCTDF